MPLAPLKKVTTWKTQLVRATLTKHSYHAVYERLCTLECGHYKSQSIAQASPPTRMRCKKCLQLTEQLERNAT